MNDLLIEQDERGYFFVWWKWDECGLLSSAGTREEAIRDAMVKLASAMMELIASKERKHDMKRYESEKDIIKDMEAAKTKSNRPPEAS